MTMSAPPDVPASPGEAVERARSLFSIVRERAREVDDARAVPRELVDALVATGLVRILVPRRWGGIELGLLAQYEATIEIAQAGGSMGWVSSFLMDHPFFVAHFDERAQAEVWTGPEGPDTLIATSNAPVGTVTAADGGWRISGTYSWASGVDHCRWILLGGMAPVGDDPDGGGEHQYRLFLVPTAEVRILDTWYAAGLRGTGSKDVVADDLFVPEHRTLVMADVREGRAAGASIHANPLFHTPMMAHAGSAMAGPAIGIARGVVAAWQQYVRAKAHVYTREQVATGIPMQLCLAEAAARIDCADLLVRRALDQVQAGGPIQLADRVRNRRDITYAVRLANAAVTDLMGMAGASALRDDSPIQRGWRDVRAIANHVFCNFNAAGENYGRQAFGFPLNPRDPFF